MLAVMARAKGGLENLVLEERPEPKAPGSGEVLVEMSAAGCNFADLIALQGFYQDQQEFPFVMGMEGAGTVLAVGPDVAPAIVGSRVIVISKGTFAQRVVVPVERIVPIPKGMDLDVAAGFAIAYGTAHGALAWEGRLQPGERLLVLGAAGGVGLTAVEVGKAMGAEVIACAGGEEKLAIAKKHGADYLIDYRNEDLRPRLAEICNGGGPDVVFDPVGGDTFDPVLRQTPWGGRIVIIGFAGGGVPRIPANLLLVKNVSAHGFNFGSWLRNRPAKVRESMKILFGWWREEKIKPYVSARYDLADATAALTELRDRKATGKVVLTTGKAGG